MSARAAAPAATQLILAALESAGVDSRISGSGAPYGAVPRSTVAAMVAVALQASGFFEGGQSVDVPMAVQGGGTRR